MKMNEEIKELWTTALRSGKYKKGVFSLKQGFDGDYSYCCLGVLCELYLEAGNVGQWTERLDGTLRFIDENGDFSTAALPDAVAEWAGIVKHDLSEPNFGQFGEEVTVNGKKYQSLSGLNDYGTLFSIIADVIQEHF